MKHFTYICFALRKSTAGVGPPAADEDLKLKLTA